MRYTSTLLSVWICLSLSACQKSGTSTPTPAPTPTPTPPAPVKPLITLPPGWKQNTTLTSTFPTNIQAYVFDSLFEGKQTRAFCFAYESSNTTISFKPTLSATAKTPAEFLQQEPGTVYACINGGFFGGNQSYSLVRHNGSTLAPNIKLLSRPLGHYYPTRAAFGVSSTGAPSVGWVYHIGAGNDPIFRYPTPAPNDVNKSPLPAPDANFPTGGAAWDVASAIGGSPMLVYGGQVRVTDTAELIDINNGSARPRSAIGYTPEGIILMVAVQGDNFVAGYAGLNLMETARLMRSLGCSHAINLDGGGSTSLRIGGVATVKPSATGAERAVTSVVMITRK